MKKAFREWAFRLFTRKITLKLSRIPDNSRIEYLTNRLIDELLEQGHDISGNYDGVSAFFSAICFESGNIHVTPSNGHAIEVKRLTK